jgi:TonB family protein
MLSLRLDESAALGHLLREESPESIARRRWGLAGSALTHLLAIPLLGLISFEPRQFRQAPEIVVPRAQVTPLVAPRLRQLTQKDPNTGVTSPEVNLESLLPSPKLEQQRGSQPRPRQMAALPPMGATVGDRPSPLIEAPKIDAPVAPTPQAPLASLGSPVTPPSVDLPKAPPPSKPVIQFEKPGINTGVAAGNAQISVPNTSVSEAIRVASQGRGGGGNQVVEDFSTPSPLGGISSRPTRSRGSVELLSDPTGIDFKPYLIQVLAAVKRNWFAVMPESARFGRRGQVRIQFAISRNGDVPKLVIASSSGFEAFDRAAVAGVSASNPFPPLPREFQGNEVRLQFTFSYNVDQ